MADSAFPIGSAAHSFGIETLVEAGLLTVENLAQFMDDYLEESGGLEAAYCAASCKLAASAGDISDPIGEWLAWNVELGARKPAREPRAGSAAMGRRFLRLAASMSGAELLTQATEAASRTGIEIHLAASFGFAAGVFGIDERTASAAYLQQSATALISACQRLLPLGQTQAHQILWDLKPAIISAVERTVSADPSKSTCFMPLVDVAGARHATMYTRLFMS